MATPQDRTPLVESTLSRYASTDSVSPSNHSSVQVLHVKSASMYLDTPSSSSDVPASHCLAIFARGLYMLLTVLISGTFATAFLAINSLYSIAVIVLGPVFGSPWLGWDHEATIFGMLLRMEFRRAEFYRTHAEALDKLAGKHGGHLLTKRETDRLLQEIVQAQNDAVQEQLDSGEKIIETKDTMSLSSVVVATVFFGAYLVYFWCKGWVFGAVTSKVHDGLAIVLPMLLQEEMATGLSQVLLWYKWTPFSVDALIASTFGCIVAPHTRTGAFEAQVNKQCLSVGVGAPDMTGFTAFITSLWTLFFLIQGYIVERLGGDGDMKGERADHMWLTDTYWFFLYYSAGLVLFCYFPFVCHISQLKKKDLESVAATCRIYLFLKRMGKTQSYLCRHPRANIDQDQYYMIRHLRYQTLLKMSADDVISYALYVVALSTYNFGDGTVGTKPIWNLPSQTTQPSDELESLSPLV
ncbi:hypothetical protein As57867_024011, partial [Aphanomyces stellatus]